jgi:aldose 1-epimerase
VARPPSGEQFEIVHGEQRATIVEVGGGIREYSCGGRQVLEPYPLLEMCDGAHGAVLLPWPNRLADGRYRFDGRELQLALSEPAKGNAIHGLARWRAWRALEFGPSSVTMSLRLHPEPGYPFDLQVTVQYTLAANGLTVSTTARNEGSGPCPYAVGHHPYLSPGAGTIDACTLELPADTVIETDAQRQLPSGRRAVAGGPLDFRRPRTLGNAVIDGPFTDLRRDGEGFARARLTAADGSCVELFLDAGYELLEVFTGDTLAPARRRTGLGLEPMTSPPNAFATGDRLIRLAPGESHRVSWGVGLTG